MTAALFAARSAARRGISQMLGRGCVARRPLADPKVTVTCCGRLSGAGYYCSDCQRRLHAQSTDSDTPAAGVALPDLEGGPAPATSPDTSPSDT